MMPLSTLLHRARRVGAVLQLVSGTQTVNAEACFERLSSATQWVLCDTRVFTCPGGVGLPVEAALDGGGSSVLLTLWESGEHFCDGGEVV